MLWELLTELMSRKMETRSCSCSGFTLNSICGMFPTKLDRMGCILPKDSFSMTASSSSALRRSLEYSRLWTVDLGPCGDQDVQFVTTAITVR